MGDDTIGIDDKLEWTFVLIALLPFSVSIAKWTSSLLILSGAKTDFKTERKFGGASTDIASTK